MTDPGEIIRIAAKGDGVTADGRHAAGAAPGDVLMADGAVQPGPHHAAPVCRHFVKCGGCQLQHVDDPALADFVRDRVVLAAEGQGVVAGKVATTHLSPPRSRRRATLHAVGGGVRPLIGFREAGSHKVIDLAECHVLRPELFALVAPLRAMLGRRRGRCAIDIELVLTDQGVDCGVRNLPVEGLEETETVLAFASDNGLARLTLDMGYGPEPMWEPQPVTVTLGGVATALPPGAFLQATEDGEAALTAAACEWLGGCASVADLFSGLGTFAFALGKDTKVTAVEAARDAHLACRQAARRSGRQVEAVHRDLFRDPLRADELARFDGVLLDPPRAGARDQIAQIAASSAACVAYISCNPASWARDAKTLVEAGFRLEELRPVGQFRWSTHVELASLFLR